MVGKTHILTIFLTACGFAGLLIHATPAAAGQIVAWGRNDSHQTDAPADTDFVAVAAGSLHSLALKADGSIAAWGRGTEHQCDVPPGNDYISISAGGFHNLALKADGSIVGWGLNDANQTEQPDGNDFLAVAAGERHNLALRSDGSVVCWGENTYRQTDAPQRSDYTALAAGAYHCLTIVGATPDLKLINPNGAEALVEGANHVITWRRQGYIPYVLLEYSADNGSNWAEIVPNTANTTSFLWPLPTLTSNQCLLRISGTGDWTGVTDTSNAPFTIYQCMLNYDFNGDCFVNLFDFGLVAAEWLSCGNPYDPNCTP